METSTNYSKTAGVRRADKSENTTLFRNVYLWMTMPSSSRAQRP